MSCIGGLTVDHCSLVDLSTLDGLERLAAPCSLIDSHPFIRSVDTLVSTFVQLSTTKVTIVW